MQNILISVKFRISFECGKEYKKGTKFFFLLSLAKMLSLSFMRNYVIQLTTEIFSFSESDFFDFLLFFLPFDVKPSLSDDFFLIELFSDVVMISSVPLRLSVRSTLDYNENTNHSIYYYF